MPTTLLISAAYRLLRELLFDAREQVIDVVPLQHALSQGEKHRAALLGACSTVEQLVPLFRQRLELLLVLQAFGLDRRARGLEARLPGFRRRPVRAHLAH